MRDGFLLTPIRCLAVAIGIFALFTLPFSSVAQTDSTKAKKVPEIKYPYKMSDYDLGYFPNITIGAGLRLASQPFNPGELMLTGMAGYRYKDKGFVNVVYDFPMLAKLDYQYEHLSEQPNLQTTNKFYIYSEFEVGFGYFFKEETLTPHKVFTVAEDDSLSSFFEPVVEYSEPSRNSWAARGGALRSQGIVSNLYLDTRNLIASDGTVIGQGGGGSVFNETNINIYHTNYRVASGYLGVEFRRIRNRTRPQDDSDLKVKSLLRAYGDIVIAPKIDIDTMGVRNFETGQKIAYDVAHDNGGGFEKRIWGFRVGGELLHYLNAKSGISFGLETGIRPGIGNVYSTDGLLGSLGYVQGRIQILFGIAQD